MRNVSELQRRLIELGYLAPGQDDGRFGQVSMDAFNHFLASKGKPKHEGLVRLDELNAELFPDELPPPKPAKPISQLALLWALFNLWKGNTVTNDQITGLLRTALLGIGAYLAGKGYIPALTPELAATIATAIVGVWSWFSNRPKTITKIGQ